MIKEQEKNSENAMTSKALHKKFINDIGDKIHSLIADDNFSPKDIMVLVQKRKPLTPMLINELKSRGIDVAGSDRIVLPEFPPIRDLLNLIRFCINKKDDYSLCCTLKSPIYRLNEGDILKLCVERNKLNKDMRREEIEENGTTVLDILSTQHKDIYQDLISLISLSETVGPYSFFMKVLNTNETREKIITALGAQVIDPLEEFLTICLSYERTRPGTLKDFIKWFIIGGSEIKRDMDESAGVRIVTVHGSKGLEAPVVFLIDTIKTPNTSDIINIKSQTENNLSAYKDTWIWTPRSTNSERLKEAKDTDMSFMIEEYYRLLYVAMTRARDRLYIYGITPHINPPLLAWHTQLVDTLANMPDVKITNDNIIRFSND